jgi:hypothetical protein
MSRQLGSVLGVAILVAIIGHPTAGSALAGFRDGWSFIIAAMIASAVALLAVGPVQVGGAVEPSQDEGVAELSVAEAA